MAGQGSARVSLKEIDLSRVREPEVLPVGVPAAVVGSAKRGPAFVPKTFANMQQFGEVFGSMQERSKESNANRFGPLALNEWMRNAQAGTFLKVLGIGDSEGRMNSDKTVDGAGFVVGDKISHNSDNELQLNPHAEIAQVNEVGAAKAARTHFLGCFMKDASGSTFLQDAGIQGELSQGTLAIKFGALPSNNSHITIVAYKDGSPDSKTYGFNAGGGEILDQGDGVSVAANLVIDTTAQNSGSAVATALSALIQGANGNNASVQDSKLQVTVVGDTITLTQVDAGANGNTEVAARLLAGSADKIITTGSSTISNTVASETLQFREGLDGTKSTAVIAINAAVENINAAESETLVIQSINSVGTVSGTATVTFVDIGIGAAGFSAEEKLAGYKVTAGNAVSVITGDSGNDNLTGVKGTLSNLASALNDSNLTSTYSEGLRAALSADGTSITITQGFAGTEGDVATIAETLGSAAFTIQGVAADGNNQENFSGGAAASNASISLSFSGQPNRGDSIEIPGFTGAGASEVFVIVPDQDGQVNGNNDTGNIKVELGDELAITLDNLKNAIHNNAEGNIDSGDVTVQVSGNVVTITTSQSGLSENLGTTLKLASSVTASNPQGDSFVCNFGTKTTTFGGGESDNAEPVIRGLLMTPQGVVPALDTNVANYTAIPADEANITKDVASVGNLIVFGNTAASNLIGYEVGIVGSTFQDFKVVLNGFNPQSGTDSEGAPKVLACSFDPENVNYFANVLNTDPTQIESRGHYLHIHWDIDKSKATPSASGLFRDDGATASLAHAGFCMHTSQGPKTATADIPDFESYNTRFRTACSPWFVSQSFGGLNKKLFKLHALDDGKTGNDRFRIQISNIAAPVSTSDFGTFDLTLEDFYSDPVNGEVLASWKKLSLDPNSKNFIGRVIGTKHMYYDFDRASSKQKLVEEGDYEVRNKYVRVELSSEVELGDIDRTALVAGFAEYRALNTTGTGLLSESGANGASPVLASDALNSLKVLPLPLVKNITRTNGLNTEASEVISWGVKFAKQEKESELNDIRFNPSIKSWTMFVPDMAGSGEVAASKLSSEIFSLEKIAVAVASDIDWSTSVYARDGVAPSSKEFITLSDAASVGRNVKFLKFRCLMQGGFDGLNIFDKQKAELTNVAAFREANDETDANKFTGPTVVAYKKAIDVLADKSATEFQLLAIPGLREPLITDYAMTACESRFDAMLVMDIEETNESGGIILNNSDRPDVGRTTLHFAQRRLDTSFAAAYFPDVIMRRTSNGSPLQVPPSVGMFGVMSLNDTLADPWFAPAGLSRGRLSALNTKVQMNRDVLNDLYDEDINPIYEPAGRAGEVYAFGQKTLMQNPSALDRINVRRLLISLRRRVKAIANTLLFEPNRASTLARFSALVEPIMAEVQARQGIERYKVQIDTTTTTQNDVENNTIRGKIYLQPTKSIEFISLDFVVTNSID